MKQKINKFSKQNFSRHIFCHHICRMIENKKIKNLSCNYTSSLKKKNLSLELERCLVDSFIQSSISLYPNSRRIVLYLFTHRWHLFTSRDILLPKIAEQMPLRQQQGTWTSDSIPPGLYIISGTNRWAAGGFQPAPPTATLLPKGRGDGATHPKGFRWEGNFERAQIRVQTGPTDNKLEVWIRPST